MALHRVVLAVLAASLLGCSRAGSTAAFPELLPVSGVVQRAGAPVAGGAIRFIPVPEQPAYAINAVVGRDGAFTLTTVLSADRAAPRKPGAPPGVYRVNFIPLASAQGEGGEMANPTELPFKITLQPDTPMPIIIELTRK